MSGVYCTAMVSSEEDKVRIIRILGMSNTLRKNHNHIKKINNQLLFEGKFLKTKISRKNCLKQRF